MAGSKPRLVWSAARAERVDETETPAAPGEPLVDLTAREVDRFELKYWVPNAVCRDVVEYARPYLVLDPWNVKMGLERQYNTTLYLETARLDAYWTHVDQAADRYKLRVRAYGEIPAGLAFFETKRKINAITVKTRSPVALAEVGPILDGTGEIPASLSSEERRNLENFLYLQTVTDARPCVLVRAHRESYCTPDPREDVRLTFDRDICFQPALGTSFHGDPREWVPIDGYDQHRFYGEHTMIELKFPRIAPAWMGYLVNRLDMWRVGYSKYVAAVQTLIDGPMMDAMAWDFSGEND